MARRNTAENVFQTQPLLFDVNEDGFSSRAGDFCNLSVGNFEHPGANTETVVQLMALPDEEIIRLYERELEGNVNASSGEDVFREPQEIPPQDGPSVPYFEIKLEMLKKWAEISGLEGLINNKKAQEKYGDRAPTVVRKSIEKKNRLPKEIYEASARLVGRSALIAAGEPEDEVEQLQVAAYWDLKRRYSESKNSKARTKEIERLTKYLALVEENN